MLAKRIVPCLDIKDGRTVKGTNFIDLRDAGDPVELALRYCNEGADELVFLDITATGQKRKTLSELVKRIATNINIPFTVGGGIASIEDVSHLLENGADKISINTAAVMNPGLIDQLAGNFGSQCVVVAIDTIDKGGKDYVATHGGKRLTPLLTEAWAREVVDRGAGEVLLTSMDRDGTRQGFSIGITRALSSTLPVPVIASGGAGSMQHFAEVFQSGRADAALAASVFHFREIPIPELKDFLSRNGILVREQEQDIYTTR